MSLTEKFRNYILSEGLFRADEKLLLAVSGGVDSVVLADLCRAAGYSFAIAHCNFKLRGAESTRDADFVRALAENYGVPFYYHEFETTDYATMHGVGIQVAARELRYEWFGSLPGDKLLTAHHKDDNIETLLMNFFRGTGTAGLKAILPRQEKLVRPLLFAGKDDIRAYADQNGLQFVEDCSNLTDKYTRNYFRNQLIPGLQQIFPAVLENLSDNIERFREIDQVVANYIANFTKKHVIKKGSELYLPVLMLQRAEARSTLIHELIKAYGFSAAQTAAVVRLLGSVSGKMVVSATHRILRDRKWLVVSPLHPVESGYISIEAGDEMVALGTGRLKITRREKAGIKPDAQIAQLDARLLKFPLLVRRWRSGDYFYPLGMQKKKKLSRFFIDQKLGLHEKEKTWVVEMDKKIVWVVGMRIDNRFRITEQTTQLVELELLPPE